MSDDITEIKKLLKTKKLVMGTKETLKKLKTKGLETVYIANNCPTDVKENIEHYTNLAGVNLITLNIANDELGDICKKSFFISVLGVAKD